MEFHEIDGKGPIWIQRVSSNPTWSAACEGRILYNTVDHLLYFSTNTGWVTASGMFGPGSSTSGYIPQWNGTDGTTLSTGVQLDTDEALTANSDTKIPSQQAVKAYVDTHAADTSTHGVTEIVGKDETQTLTNKTLTSPHIDTGNIDDPDIDGGTIDGTTLTSIVLASFASSTAIKTDLSSNSDSFIPTVKAVKTAVDTTHAALTTGTHGVGAGSIVGTTLSQELTNKTLTSPTVNTGISGTAIDNDTSLTADSAIKVPTQHAVKSYVDAVIVVAGGDITAHVTDTSTHGTTTAIVGKDDVQTLTNKTLTNPTVTTGTFGGPTLTGPIINSSVSGNVIDVASDLGGSGASDTKLATQKAVRTYVLAHTNLTSNVHGATGDIVGTTGSQNLFSKTLTSPTITTPTITTPTINSGATINTSISGTAIDNDTSLAGDSATKVPTQHAVKSYVDGLISSGGGDLGTHVASSSVHGVSGAVVGTNNTQTLTNKALTTNTSLTSPTITTPTINGNLSGTSISTVTTLGTSNFVVPTQNAVKVYVDTQDASGSSALSSHTALTAAHDATGDVVGRTKVQTLTNKTLTNPTINEVVVNTKISGTAIKTGLTENSDDYVPTQKAVKTYADGLYFPAGTKLWFFQDTAPTGWTIDTYAEGDGLIAVKGGSGHYNVPGHNHGGDWHHGWHTHATKTHTLTIDEIPAHLHYTRHKKIKRRRDRDETTGDDSYGTTDIDGLIDVETDEKGHGYGHHHSNTEDGCTTNTWRPRAHVGIICSKD